VLSFVGDAPSFCCLLVLPSNCSFWYLYSHFPRTFIILSLHFSSRVHLFLHCTFLVHSSSFHLCLTTFLFSRSNYRLFTKCVSDLIRPCRRSLHFASLPIVIRWLPPKSCGKRVLRPFLYSVDR